MRRTLARTLAVGGIAVALLVGAGLGVTSGPDRAGRPAAGFAPPVTEASTVDELSRAVDGARERLARVPGDWVTWAQLGLAYVQRARVTGDPSGYPRAEEALRRSLSVHPDGNTAALTGLGALAAARHDFTLALHYGRSAVAVDGYRAAAHGVVADALIELGRYDEAYAAIQRMVDLRPDTGSYARASYAWELRGDLDTANALMRQALLAAPGPSDAAFARLHLAELAFGAGDLDAAAEHVTDGLRRLPDHPPLLAVRARLAAARGDLAAAVADYRAALARLPQPGYAAELGDLLAASGDPAGAAREYDLVRATARLLAAQGVDVDVDLALFDAEHGAAEQAVTAARAGYAKRPSIVAADALAWALHLTGRHAEALGYADRALSQGTRSAPMRFHRGMILASLGRRAPAAADLTEALRINPYFSVRCAAQARAALAALGGAS